MLWLILILSAAVITIIVLLATGVIKLKKSNGKGKGNYQSASTTRDNDKEKDENRSNFINPRPFDIGLLKNPPQGKLANVCAHDANPVRYPIKNLDVKYGLKPISDRCPCLQFIEAP